ncbi:hypothetical protein HanIR_Chr01g0048931 [Helianthus annuus]|nr:hypothetical protein HanIR_Chr01g0048931 [Helianthus annuus]
MRGRPGCDTGFSSRERRARESEGKMGCFRNLMHRDFCQQENTWMTAVGDYLKLY